LVKSLRENLRCLLGSSERGSLLVEALFSAAIVAMAFTATTLAFNSSTSSATRDINKSGALTVAQSQLEYMRSVGQADVNKLVGTATVTGLDGTSRTLTYAGVRYTVSYRAYYVDSMGSGTSDSCGSSFATGGTTSAQYVYIKVSVTYPIPGGTAPAITMDSYFAPEGGSSQSSTGTLKVYVLGTDGNPIASVTQVDLKLNAATVDTKTLNANGCVLFTGLARGVYTISVPDNTLQDLYMTSRSSIYTRKVPMPARGAIVQKIVLAQPVTITPIFKATLPTTGTAVVAPATANKFVNDTLGANSGTGMWIGTNTNVTDVGYTDYTLNPGKVFMPHFNANPVSMASQLYPDPAGYSAYPGPCTANYPGAGNLQPIVSPSWANPTLWLTKLATTAGLTSSAQPTPNAAKTYYWNQAFISANVKVKLIGDNTGARQATSDCGPRPSLYNTWVSLGSIISNNATISDLVQALPTGEYDVCVGINYTYSKGTGSQNFLGQWSMSNITNSVAGIEYVSPGAAILPYKALPVTRTATLNSPYPGMTTPCG
jgi:type II secretory pathway pseudopilin PulG